MRFKKRPQLPGAGRTRAGHHHGSHTPTSPGAILPCQPKHIGRQCKIILAVLPESFTTQILRIINVLISVPCQPQSKTIIELLESINLDGCGLFLHQVQYHQMHPRSKTFLLICISIINVLFFILLFIMPFQIIEMISF